MTKPTDLDEKLMETLDDWGIVYDRTDIIGDLKQAFSEAGFVPTPFTVLPDAGYVVIKDKTYLSGQEWFSRFEKAIKGKWDLTNPAGNPAMSKSGVLEAAKRASGLKESIDG